ncbi:MAG TPA: transglutaminase family protein [Xanthobacteraceae bacterium]|jgi:transglutaminase-like putative cysteine protease|nr:transglutaminase family protein [Xanthobacteraceae bacterium]
MTSEETNYLSAASFVDSGDPAIRAFAHQAAGGAQTAKDKALALYGAVRDSIQYDPYVDFLDPAVFRASDVLRAGKGFCVGKSALLTAAARAAGIPARPGYADVRNHLTSKRLQDLVDGDIFYWHSYTELNIDGKWVKCTPAFDAALCARAKIAPLDFDGVNDSLFHPFDPAGRRHMEYLKDRGAFPDVPFATIIADFKKFYPKLVAASPAAASFRDEVTT